MGIKILPIYCTMKYDSCLIVFLYENVKVSDYQEIAQSERNSHSTKRGVGKIKWHLGTYTKKTYHKPSEQIFPNRQPLNYPNIP